MVSENKKIATIYIVVLIILAFTIYVLFPSNRSPESSPAEQMILKPSDIGPDWIYTPPIRGEANMNSNCYAYLNNDTIRLNIIIDVFNSTSDSREVFDLRSAWVFGSENINLGDGAIYFLEGTSYPRPNVIFIRSYVLAQVETIAFIDYVWQKNATIDIAFLQLQKIDQYLAQHPGES